MNGIVALFNNKALKSVTFTRLSHDAVRIRMQTKTKELPYISDIEIETLKPFKYTGDGMTKEYL